jgi:hypothetical protein
VDSLYGHLALIVTNRCSTFIIHATIPACISFRFGVHIGSVWPCDLDLRYSCLKTKQQAETVAVAPQSLDDVLVQAIDFLHVVKFL